MVKLRQRVRSCREYIEYRQQVLLTVFKLLTATSVAYFEQINKDSKMTTLVAQDLTSFVFASNDEIKTTSLLVAEKFGKLHKDVLKKIESLECSAEFIGRNFALIETDVKVGFGTRKSPAYEMTKDGFMFLVMGFTGKAAAEVKELYINAFNFMLAKLFPKTAYALRDLPPVQPQTLTPAMLRHIEKRIAWLNKNQVGSTYAGLGRLIKEKFNVNERKAIPVHKYAEVCALLGCEPDAKALQGELVESAAQFKLPTGMVLIAETELADLKNRPASTWGNYATMMLALPNDNNRMLVSMYNGVTTLFEIPESYMVGDIESLERQLKLSGYHLVKDNPQNKLETIEKIVTAKFAA
jgi:Rha family phage regulatory protein